MSATSVEMPGFEAEAFERLAQQEASHFWFRARNRLLTWALERYFPNARSLIDVGAGSGYVLSGIAAARPGLRLVAADPYDEALAIIRRRVPEAATVRATGQRLPFGVEFDVVCAFDVLEHIDDDQAALHELHRIARPSGGAMITVPQHPRLWSAADEYGYHRRRYLRRELLERAGAAGFEPLLVTSFMTATLPLMIASRLRDRHKGAAYDPDAELRVGPRANRVLEGLLAAEQAVIRRGVSLPAGSSLLLVARKPGELRSSSGPSS